MQKLIDVLVAQVQRFSQEEDPLTPLFPKRLYNVFPLEQSRFSSFTSAEGSLAFVDGGNAVLFASPNLCLQFVRVYASIYKDNKKVKGIERSGYVLCTAQVRDGGLHYDATLFCDGEPLEHCSVAANDPKLRRGTQQGSITVVGDIVRRFSELQLAKDIESEVDVVVLDGNLKSTFPDEEQYFAAFTQPIVGVSKTNSTYLHNGALVSTHLLRMAKEPSWFYGPVATSLHDAHLGSLYFGRLHALSEYCFKIECSPLAQKKLAWVMSLLMQNSSDPVFLGYPYGLVDADRYARVSDEEKSYRATKLEAETGGSLRQLLSNSNAHAVLDSI